MFEVVNQKSGQPELLFRNRQENFATVLKCDSVEFVNDHFWEKIADKINTLIYNRVKFEDRVYENEQDLMRFIEERTPVYTPQEKMNLILEYFHSRTSFDGQTIQFNQVKTLLLDEMWRKFYFRHSDEFLFYVGNLESQTSSGSFHQQRIVGL